MTQVTKIQFLQALLPKIGAKETETMVNYIDHSIELNNEEICKKLATKDDLNKLELRVVEMKTDMIKWVFSVFVVLMVAIIGLYIKK